MKNLLAPLLTGTILVVSGCASANNSLYQYPFSSAKIAYSITGTTDGTSTVTMKGDRSVREAHVVFHKSTGDEKQDNLYIDDGQFVYSIDLDKNIGTKMKNPLYDLLMQVDPAGRQDYLTKISIGDDPTNASTQQLQPVGNYSVAGQQCQIYETGTYGQVCLWNSIPLKSTFVISDLLKEDTVATSVQTDVDVPDSAFDIPAGVTITDETGTTGGTQQTAQPGQTQA